MEARGEGGKVRGSLFQTQDYTSPTSGCHIFPMAWMIRPSIGRLCA